MEGKEYNDSIVLSYCVRGGVFMEKPLNFVFTDNEALVSVINKQSSKDN